ncbi:MAG: sporulation protein YqfD [Bacillota bacterium]
MLRRLIAFLLGTLRIEISRGSIELFLNLALSERIHLWDIQRLPDKMQATLILTDFFALRPVARGSRCRVRILRRVGFPFLAHRLRYRPMLIAGAAACLAALVWAAGHLWVVEVRITGPKYLDPRAVAAVAAEAGLRRGAWKADIDLIAVAQHLKERIDEVSWAVIRVQGTRAVIEVVEKASVVPPNKASCVHLVARKSGVIEQVIPFQGEPLIKKGHIVKPGDMLVECALRYWSGGRPGVIPGMPLPPREDVARTLVAQASVRALVSYRQYLEYPTIREVTTPTGKKETQWVLKWNDRSILLRGKKTPAFERYETSARHLSLGKWRNWKSPVELVIREIDEVTVRREAVPLAELEQRAREAMERRLAWLLGPADKIVRPIQTEVTEQSRGFAGILVTVETLEEISSPLEGSGPVMPEKPEEESKSD